MRGRNANLASACLRFPSIAWGVSIAKHTVCGGAVMDRTTLHSAHFTLSLPIYISHLSSYDFCRFCLNLSMYHAAVFSAWQFGQRHCRFDASSLPPSASETMWSVSYVAGRRSPHEPAHRHSCWHAIFFLSGSLRCFRASDMRFNVTTKRTVAD